MNISKFEDIRPGDTIKATTRQHGVLVERRGTVAYIAEGLSTREGGYIWNSAWTDEWVFDLIDRPTPPLPTQPGSVIIADRITGFGTPHTALALRHDGWWVSLQTGRPFAAASIAEWTAAKVVEA